eukprot:9569166-Karenia_brevis.AAC.1
MSMEYEVFCVQSPRSTLALSNMRPAIESIAEAKYGCNEELLELMVTSLYDIHRVFVGSTGKWPLGKPGNGFRITIGPKHRKKSTKNQSKVYQQLKKV